jgi:2-amino-4-hydroxy-6-hydroxymethyldihydropteridine diphosphokinase
MGSEARPELIAFVGLGANLGDPQAMLRWALDTLAHTPGVRLVQASALYRSAPVDASGPDFVNAVAKIATTLNAMALLSALQAIENTAGRERPYRNAPRTLDLDLLLFGDAQIDSPTLTVPHPRMQERAFVLLPMQEVAPARVDVQALHAVAGQGVERLSARGG